jgi:hypothetical protein
MGAAWMTATLRWFKGHNVCTYAVGAPRFAERTMTADEVFQHSKELPE